MPGILDALLVGGAVIGAGVYLVFYLIKKRGCESCGSGGKREKIQIHIPKG